MNFFQPDAKKLEFIWCLHGNFLPAAVPTCSLAKKDHWSAASLLGQSSIPIFRKRALVGKAMIRLRYRLSCWGELLVSERQRGTGCHYRHTRTLWFSHQILHQRPVHSKEKLLKRLLSYTSVWISLLMTVVLLCQMVGVSQFREVTVIE